MDEETEYLEHYGVLGMKWGIRRQEKKASRNTKKASKVQMKIDNEKDQISKSLADLKTENARRIKSKEVVSGTKNEIRQLGNKVKNEDYGILFRKRKEKKAKKQLADAQKEYKKAIDLDLEIESNQDRIRADIQRSREAVDRYTSKQIKYINKAEIAKGKAIAKQIKLDEKLKEKK